MIAAVQLLALAVLAPVGCAAPTTRVQPATAHGARVFGWHGNPKPIVLRTDERERFRRLWLRGEAGRLRAELIRFAGRTATAEEDEADAAFLRGDRAAGFHEYWRPQFASVATMTIGGWYEPAATLLRARPFASRDRVTAALLIGDAQAACGRYREARAAWLQSLDDAEPAERDVYYPEWTSSLRRLLAYREAPERSRVDVQCMTAQEAARRNAIFNAQCAHPSAQLEAGWESLNRGDARGALRSFDAAMPFWRRRSKGAGRGYGDAERGTLIAALFARDDERAERELQLIRNESGGEALGTKLLFAGRSSEALIAYRDHTAQESTAEGVDQIVAAGVDAALAGNLHQAIVMWSGPPSSSGSGYLEDEQTALVGIAHAERREWDAAVDEWIEASRMGRPVPDWEGLEYGNIIALEMLYHFRADYQRGDFAYHRHFARP